MAIENRNLAVGTRLVSRYKKQTHKAEVLHTEDGVKYQLEDGRQFKSLSSAGTAITGGPINGWSFWSLETEGQGAKQERPKVEKAKKANGVIRRTPNQKGAPEGQVRYFCSACLDSFYAEEGETPAACPKGHDESFGEVKSDSQSLEGTKQEPKESITE